MSTPVSVNGGMLDTHVPVDRDAQNGEDRSQAHAKNNAFILYLLSLISLLNIDNRHF